MISPEIKSMSVKQKLRLMEELWESLLENEDQIKSPAWHEDVLKQREQLVREGKDEYLSWDEAKKELRAKRNS